jgi:LPS-assembly lipoprotein
MRTVTQVLLSFSLIAILSGCGFQLRGDYQLPESLESIRLQSNVSKELASQMEQRLVHSGINVSKNSSYQLALLSDKLERRTLSLFESGQVAEYELLYQVSYQLLKDNQVIIERTAEVARDYQDDPNFALAKTREREMLVNEMRAEASRIILQQIVSELSQ